MKSENAPSLREAGTRRKRQPGATVSDENPYGRSAIREI
ncbi:hypothetical protein GLS_c05160 [Gluconobacter oxydans DSM 3504]|uniref:Uncharacterized protein n=1 Tax=Gluconobacter oxydans DSM 3504 TaxID=1288313 RepID=A0A067Z0Z3_GLUOY|nr:hypothetical protein GLS_c05160 [Gluconobacter oxydans DSM 3504]